MTPPLASGRRLARHCALAQLAVAGVLALCFLPLSLSAALAAALGAGVLGLGTLVVAWRGLPQHAPSASEALLGLVSGLIYKILLMFVVLFLGFGVLQLPPLPLLLGLFAGLVTFPVVVALKA